MNKRERTAVLKKVEKLRNRRRELLTESSMMEAEGQKLLDQLAKATCPYKKGQVLKQRGSQIWAKVVTVAAAKMLHGRLHQDYQSAPYQLDCLRCTSKGEVQKGKFIFIDGADIGVKWDVV